MKFTLKGLWLICDYLLLILITLIGMYVVLRQNVGVFTYALDDAYIHLAMGKNLSLYGNWGITKYEFASASSSPLWTLLLSGLYRVSGSFYEYAPILINILSCFGLLRMFSIISETQKLSPAKTQIFKIAMVLFFPFFPLIIGGMENMLFSLNVAVFLYYAFIKKSPNLPATAMISALMVALRYEGAFVIAAASVTFILQKRWKECSIISLSGITPIVLIGVYFLINGGYFFPNSLMIKGNIHNGLIGSIKTALYHVKNMVVDFSPLPFLFVFLILCTFLLWRNFKGVLSFYLFFLTSFTFGIHLFLAQVGWMYRYEAYLLAMCSVSIAVAIPEFIELYKKYTLPYKTFVSILLLVPMSMGFILRSVQAHRVSLQSSNEVFLQQIQMARFIATYFPTNNILLNDIGAVSYYSDIHCTDAYGLATKEVAELKRAKRYNSESLERICRKRGIDVAIVYPRWIESGFMFGTNVETKVPESWKKAGSLVLNNKNYVIGGDTVSFYSVKAHMYDTLHSALAQYSSLMSVNQSSLVLE